MADVQLEKGYTRIANELLDVVYGAGFNATQLKILLLIMRYTYGFGRKSHPLSINYIAGKVNACPRNVRRELQNLVDRNVIYVAQKADFSNARELALNKDYEGWRGFYCPQGLNPTPEGENVPTPEGENVPTPEGENVPQKKKSLKKSLNICANALSPDQFFEIIWEKYPRKRGKNAVKPAQRKRLLAIGEEGLTLCIERYLKENTDPAYWQYGSTFFNGGYLDFLGENYVPVENTAGSFGDDEIRGRLINAERI